MKRLFWLALLVGGYLWLLTSGHDGFVVDRGKALYQAVVHWIETADADFQTNKKEKSSKRSRRWD